MNQPTAEFLGCTADYHSAQTVLFGAPFDGTTSFRPGTRFGPDAMRRESVGLETWSPYQNRDLTDISVFDAGDLEVPFGNPAAVLDEIEQMADRILKDGKRPAMLGGEHLVTLGAMRAAVRMVPDIHILHFDAHADLREDYLGEKLSHATVLRRVWELTGDGRIHQFGIRSGCREEFLFAEKHTEMYKFSCNEFGRILSGLKNVPLYVTIDLDVLDPALFCGTGTPEAGGITFQELLDCIVALQSCHVIGFDINELSPHYDQSGASTAVACKVLREMLIATGDARER